MKRLRITLVATLLMLVLVSSVATPALAFVIGGPPVLERRGTPIPPTVCESQVVNSPNIGWRDGTCWVFHPAP
jgi:hypothetical protein